MPIITVITPVHDGGDAYLPETYESIKAQILPAGWSLQWVIQEDGEEGRALARHQELLSQPWISTGCGRPGGAARARTMGLLRAEGELIRTVDADDLLPDPKVLARDIRVLTEHPELGWVTARCLDLMPDGTLLAGPNDPTPGRLPQRHLLDGAIGEGLPVMGTTSTIRTVIVRALGGWPALPGYEDAALLLAAEAVSDGWMQDEVGELYRKHEGQSTKKAGYKNRDERNARVQAAIERAEELYRMGWRWSPKPAAAIPKSAGASRPALAEELMDEAEHRARA
ncbi:glycosyltransferase (plasmid) [Streptoverticillium reticulum]|uniref:glycosyltransferase n=1 Tax=Streptoverticillium reticulum TaxID=1433415 RepID=UPI0039BF8B93